METQNSSSSNILSPGSSTVPEMNPIEEELESDYTALTSGYLQGLKTKRKQLKEKKKKAKTKAENSKEKSAENDNHDEYPDPTLADSEVLPQYYGKFPDNLLGVPIEDLDSYYKEKGEETFCVVTDRFSNKYIYRFSASNGFFLLSPFNPLRRLALRITLNQFFDYFVMLTIIVNCAFLALDDEIIESEYVFTAIYSLEMIIKMLARGFVLNKFTYLRDLWNWLDFVVVVLAYVTIISTSVTPAGSNFNVSGLRTFRVLRAFKSFTIVPGLKTIVNALLQSLKPLAEVMVIMIFLVVVISLIALQAYQGVLLRKCVLVPTAKDNITTNDQFNAFVTNPGNWNPVDGELLVCGNTSSSGLCPAGYKCMQDIGENPNFGFTNFDHMGWALLTCFQLLTLDYWENVYNMIIRAEGAWNVLFFFMSVVLGPFYLLNLLLAVVTLAYSKEHEKQIKLRELREKAKENARRRNKRRRLLMQMSAIRDRQPQAVDNDSQQSSSIGPAANGNISTSEFFDHSAAPDSPGNVIKDNSTQVMPIIIHTSGGVETPGTPNDQKSIRNDYQSDASSQNHLHQLSYNEGNARRQKFKDSRKNISMESSESTSSQQPEWKKWFRKRKSSFNKIFCAWECHPAFKKFQKFLFALISLKVFEGLIILSILTNTLFLALDHHEISQTFDEALSIGNLVFTAIFTAEAVLKIFALGPAGYVKDKWNVFDFLIVIISLIEVTNITGDAGLSVLRTLRLMRVFRLARIWQTMRKLMSIIIKSLSAVAYLTVVLFMVLFIFAVIGKQMYSEYYINSADKFDGEIPRWNFINFYNSFLLVWRVMCGEWIELLHECMFIADYTCIPVFLAITFLGNFLVLNLFTAILLEAFNVDNLKTKQADKQTAKLKLGVEAFRKLLKKSQGKSPSNAISPESKAESNGTDTEDPKTFPPEDDMVETPVEVKKKEGRKSLSAANIFTLHQASMRIRTSRTVDNGFSGNGYQSGVATTFTPSSSEENTTYESSVSLPQSTGKKPHRKPLVKQFSMNAEIFYDSIHDQVSVQQKPESVEIREETPENSMNNGSPSSNQNITKKVSFVVSNNNEADVIENVLQPTKPRIPWYKRCSKKQLLRCCGFKVATQEVDPESNSAGGAIQGGKDSGMENQQPKEAPDCLPKWCPLSGETFCCAKTWAKFRYGVFLLVQHRIFEFFILAIILASTVCLAMEDIHLETDITRKNVLNILEYVFTSLFTLEMVLKWIGNGFTKYFTNWWCVLDFVIVVISWVGIGASAAGTVDSLRALRTLRALRPLRAISRWQGMRVVVNALIYCIPSIGNVLCVCLLIWLVFSIMGVQLYKGQFYRCVDSSGTAYNATFVPNRTICLQNNFTWTTPPINFDNVVNGMIALFQVATFEGWIEVMSDASDTDGVYNQPTRGANPYSYVFFFIFVLIGSFFILNLIVGVIIESFQKLRKQTETSSAVEAFLTESQKNFYKTMRTMLNRKPKKSIPPPRNALLLKIFKLVTHSKFEVVVFVVIVLNMLTLGMEHYRMSQNWADALRYVDIGFTSLFAVEAFLKLCGTRLYYFRDAFNVFDFVVVLLSITGFILEELLTLLVSPTLLRVVRVFRVFRVLRVIRAARGIRRLILTLMISLPALFNIAVLLGVFMVIFAILGMSFFMNVKLRGALNDIVNFRTFGNSMMLLFRLMTSAGWNDVLEPLMNEEDCEPKECGNRIIAVIYFVLYIFFVFLVIVNMYIAIILENFDEIFQQEETGVSQDDFEYFYVIWGRYDPKASQFVSVAELSNLLHSLHPPFQLAKPNEIKIAALNLPIVNGDKVHCLDVLFALVKRILGEVEISDEMRQEAEARLLKSFPNRKTLKAETTTLALRQKVKAAKIIQVAWRGFSGKRKRGIDSSSNFSSIVSLEQDLLNLSTRPAVISFGLGTTLVTGVASQTIVKKQLSIIREKRHESENEDPYKLPIAKVQAEISQTEITIIPGPANSNAPGSTPVFKLEIHPEKIDYINECTEKQEYCHQSSKSSDNTTRINDNVPFTSKSSDEEALENKGETQHKTSQKKTVEKSKSQPILKSTSTSITDKSRLADSGRLQKVSFSEESVEKSKSQLILKSTSTSSTDKSRLADWGELQKVSLSEDKIEISQSNVHTDHKKRPQTSMAVDKPTVNTDNDSPSPMSSQNNQEDGTTNLISGQQMKVQTVAPNRKSKIAKGETFPPSMPQTKEPQEDNQAFCTSQTLDHNMGKTIANLHPASSKTNAFDVAGKLDDVTFSPELTPSPTDENRVESVIIVQSDPDSKIAETKLSQIASTPTITLMNKNTLSANPIVEKGSSKKNSESNQTKPVAAKDLRFNPKTGKFKTKSNVIELVEVQEKPLDNEASKNRSIDQSMILKNNFVVE